MIFRECPQPKKGIQSIKLIPIEINLFLYNKSDLHKDLSVKRVYGKFRREKITDFLTALSQLELSTTLDNILCIKNNNK